MRPFIEKPTPGLDGRALRFRRGFVNWSGVSWTRTEPRMVEVTPMESDTVTVELDPQDRELVEFAAETSGCDSVEEYVRKGIALHAVQRLAHLRDNGPDDMAEKATRLGEAWAERGEIETEFSAVS